MLQQETDTAAHKPRFAVPVQLKSDTAIEATQPSARSEKRNAEQVSQLRPGGMRIGPDARAAVRRCRSGRPGQAQPLSAYLASNLLGGPAPAAGAGAAAGARSQAAGLPQPGRPGRAGTLFPRQLPARCLEALVGRDRRPARERTGRPYELLRWLDARLQSGGRLAGHLDPAAPIASCATSTSAPTTPGGAARRRGAGTAAPPASRSPRLPRPTWPKCSIPSTPTSPSVASSGRRARRATSMPPPTASAALLGKLTAFGKK